jgi:hypothetical protein
MKEYDIFLVKDKRSRSFKMLTWLIVTINYIFLIYSLLGLYKQWMKWLLPLLILGLAAALLYRPKKLNVNSPATWPAFIAIVISWIVLGAYLVGLINIAIYLLSLAATRRLIVHFTGNAILFPSFPQRRVSWDELNNVVLKDGILTIDFRNNKLLQQEIDEELSPVNEKEFNDFCKSQLSK